ncbi:MAG: ABC transporter substrate-binding protein [Dehalococcoidia bacterium]|nr:MAG: ABC transporter substrate-binding protein [Dehalococcoidia bacterium]
MGMSPVLRALRLPILIALIGCLALSSLIGVLALTLTTEVAPDRGGVFVEGVVGSPLTLNPILAGFNDVDRDLASLIFSGLVRLNERGEPVPELAVRWEVTPDGKAVVMALRRDAHWHDGTPFGARDVVFTIRAIQAPRFQGPPDLAESWKNVTVEALDDFTVRFRLRDAFAPFLASLQVGMLPAHLLKDVPPEALPDHPFRVAPVGTGAWKVRDVANDAVTLEANLGHYGPTPYLRTFQMRFFPDRAALLAALRRGEIQGAAGVTDTDLLRLGKSKEYQLYTAPRASFTILFLNNRSAFFRDKAVRQAIAYALNRQRIIEVAAGGLGVVADTPIPPGTWAAETTPQKIAHDPDRARMLLSEAGWAPGSDGIREKNGEKFRFALLTNDDPSRIAAAEEIARQLRQIGLRAEVSASGYSGLIERFLAPRQFDAVLFGLDPGGDPDSYSNWHSSQARPGGFNFVSYSNRKVDELLEKARTSSDPLERARAYAEFQAIFSEEVPSVLLYYPMTSYAVSREVNGVSLRLLFEPSDRFRSLPNWYVKTKRIIRLGWPRLG